MQCLKGEEDAGGGEEGFKEVDVGGGKEEFTGLDVVDW